MSRLSFLADESCDFAVVRVLRAHGYDVRAVSEEMCRSVDRELLQIAQQENRILVTEDKDFGWLVFVERSDSAGVVLLRFPAGSRAELCATVDRLVSEHADALREAFTVVQPGRIRITRRPQGA
jgi:predicted nuclease of predicted toxin-antitoxin system